MEKILPKIIATLTQHPREKVEIQWSNVYWVSNIFRLWELLAWRRSGIRAETTSYFKDGKETLFVHSWEAAICVAELKVRALFKWKLAPFKIYIPMFATPTGMRIPSSPYLFAIALNNAAFFRIGNGNITVTAGSNLCTVCIADGVSTPAPTPTIASINMVNIVAYNPGILSRQYALFQLVAPTSGTPAMGNINDAAYVATFSGVDQTTPTPNVGTGTTSASPNSVSVSIASATSWMVGGGDMSGSATSGVGGVYTVFNGNGTIFESSGGTVSSGSQAGTMSWTGGGSGFQLGTELKAVGAAVSVEPFTVRIFNPVNFFTKGSVINVK